MFVSAELREQALEEERALEDELAAASPSDRERIEQERQQQGMSAK